jgi:hypothetical protein
LRLVRQIQQAEVEHLLRVVLALQRVVKASSLFSLASFCGCRAVRGRARVRLSPYCSGVAGPDFFDRAEDLDDEHAVMRDDGAAALADDGRMRHFLRVADIGDVINDVVRVFLEV